MPRTADDDARALAHRDVNAATETNGDAMCDAAMKPNDEKDARDDDAGADDDAGIQNQNLAVDDASKDDDATTMIDAKRAREETEEEAKDARGKAKSRHGKERAAREMDLQTLPEALGEWKTNAELELGNLWPRQRLRLLDWFETKSAINKCIVSCPASALREKMRALRDDGVYGSSMIPYLQLLRDVFDETDQYKDDLDEELDFNDFFDDDDDESEDDESEDDDSEDDESEDSAEEIPVVSRAPRAEAAAEPPQRAGASRSAPSTEEMDEIKIKFSKFTQFLGQYFSEKRLEVENVVEIVDHAARAGFDDPQEVNKFLEVMQKQNKIMYDQSESQWTVYIL
jgi:hypothetical protein